MGFGRKQSDDKYASENDFEEEQSIFLMQVPSPQTTYDSPDSPYDKESQHFQQRLYQ